jgi:hypothetical protein
MCGSKPHGLLPHLSLLRIEVIEHRSKGSGYKFEYRRITMAEQFQNPQATKVENKTEPETATEKIDKVAEHLAEKSAKTEKKFDKDHEHLFTK